METLEAFDLTGSFGLPGSWRVVLITRWRRMWLAATPGQNSI
jgi:hypothetical protein